MVVYEFSSSLAEQRNFFTKNTPCRVRPESSPTKSKVQKPCINITEYEHVPGSEYEYEAVEVGVCLRFKVDGGALNPKLPKGEQ